MFMVIGTTTADLFISGVDRVPRFDGDEFTTSSLAFCDRPLTMTLGGNGANSAYVLRSLGAPVALCSATGTNAIGETIAGWLVEKDVDLCGFLRREDGTATTTTVMDARLNRISFYYPGIFPTFTDADIPEALWAKVHTLLVTGGPLLPNFRGEALARTLHKARSHRIAAAVDIGPAIAQPFTLDEIEAALPLADTWLVNAYELAVATGTDDIREGMRQMQTAGAAQIVCKLGKAGALLLADGVFANVSGFPVQASVTIGAGDSFNAGLLYALHEGLPLAEAARFANATAALVVQTGQSVLGAPGNEQIQAFLSKQEAD